MQILVVVWLFASVFAAVVGNAIFVMWLRARGAPMTFAWAGLSWYVNRVYVDWCRSQGREPGRILLARRIVDLNLIAAVVVALPLLMRGR